jgi:hypothetical protein
LQHGGTRFRGAMVGEERTREEVPRVWVAPLGDIGCGECERGRRIAVARKRCSMS